MAAQTTLPPSSNATAPAAQPAPAAKPASAAAPPCDDEMTFTAWTSGLGQSFGTGTRQYVFADGSICPDTDRKFQQFMTANPPKAPVTIVVMNSPGGDVGASLRMGEFIRKQKFWTEVGSQFPLMIPQNDNIPQQAVPFLSEPSSPPFPGACYSACTMAFLGGVVRIIGYASNYGVHQFESDAQATSGNGDTLQYQTELASAEIVVYLSEMGISSNWLAYMAQKRGSNSVTYLTMKQMQDLNVITPRWQTKWQIAPRSDNTGFFLDGLSTDPWGVNEIAFSCAPTQAPAPASTAQTPGQALQNPQPATTTASRPPPPPVVLIGTFVLDPGTRGDAQSLVKAVTGYALEASGELGPALLSAKGVPPVVLNNRLAVTLPFSQSDVADLETIPTIGMAFLFDPAAKLPMRLLNFEADLDGTLLKQYVATCH